MNKPDDYKCRECGALVLYRSDHDSKCIYHPDYVAAVHQLATATPSSATCACGAVALSKVPLRAIDLIEQHIERSGGKPL